MSVFGPFNSVFNKTTPTIGHELTEDNSVPYMERVISSVVMDLDATISQSYSGSGNTWANLTPSPADGSAKSAYDFYLGDGSTPTTYPTFTGSAGSQSAYWAFDGGDYFTLKSGANPPFIASMHKTTGGSDFWIAVAFYTPVPDTNTDGFLTQ